jgi:putative addiction module component (TIGR02574 family)
MNIKEEISKMSSSRRILLVQEIWHSIREDSIELSEPIRKELENRLELHNAGKMEYLSIDDVRKELAGSK